MPMPFDATLKELVQRFLHDYEQQMGLGEFAPLKPLNVDLSTISAATDIALGQGDPPIRVVDINFQSGPDDSLPARVLLYNALLHYRYAVPVHSVVVLLRPGADHKRLSGKLRYKGRKRKGKLEFTYEIVRMWRQPVRRFLEGGLGTLPLAPLCRVSPGRSTAGALAPIIRQVADRLEHEATSEDRDKLLTATYVLAGLRVSKELTDKLFQGVMTMKESATYQGILEEGREEGRADALHETLLRQGKHRFGPPTARVRNEIALISDSSRLERMTERLLVVSNWRELLDTP